MEKAPASPTTIIPKDVNTLQYPHQATQGSRQVGQDLIFAAKGGGITFAGRVFEYAIRFVFSIFVARAIGAENFGLYTLGLTVALIASNLSMLGLQTGMARFLPPAIQKKDNKEIWGIIQISFGLPVVLGLGLSLGLYLLADPIANLLFHDPRLAPLFMVISFVIPIDTVGMLAYVVTISYKEPKYSVLANNILIPLIKLLLAGIFLAIGFSTFSILVAQVIASLVGAAVLLYFMNRLFALRRPLGAARREPVKLLKYSLPVQLGWMVNTVRSTLSTLMLGFLGLTTGVGIFAAASRFSIIGSMFFLSIGNISTPILADFHSRGESAKMEAYYQTTTRWIFIFNLPVFLTTLLFAEQILMILGEDFTAGAVCMMILAVGTLVYTSTGIGANILDMTDHPKVNTANSIIMFALLVILNILLVPRWGIVGAATASALSTVMTNLVCLFEVGYLLHMYPYNLRFLKPFFAGFSAAAATYALLDVIDLSYLVQLLLGCILLWGSYALILVLLGLPEEDRFILELVRSKIDLLLRYRNLISR